MRTLHLPDEEVFVEPVCAGKEEELGSAAGEEFVAQTGEPACALREAWHHSLC